MYYESYDDEINQYIIGNRSIIISTKNNPTKCDDNFYSYSLEINFFDKKHYEVAVWCEENCIGEWLVGIEESAFMNKEDAMAFKLTWT